MSPDGASQGVSIQKATAEQKVRAANTSFFAATDPDLCRTIAAAERSWSAPQHRDDDQ
jgi:hypothetical protein